LLPHSIRDLIDAIHLAETVPNLAPGATTVPPETSTLCEQPERSIEPKQLNQSPHVARRILPPCAHPLETQPGSRRFGDLNLPPRRDHVDSVDNVLGANDEARASENPPVHGNLPGKPPQTVAIRFDLVAMNRAVHHRDVHEDLAAAQADLLEEHDVDLMTVLLAKTPRMSVSPGGEEGSGSTVLTF
jgi:hypothetical protein